MAHPGDLDPTPRFPVITSVPTGPVEIFASLGRTNAPPAPPFRTTKRLRDGILNSEPL